MNNPASGKVVKAERKKPSRTAGVPDPVGDHGIDNS